jgi:hypothetical protein
MNLNAQTEDESNILYPVGRVYRHVLSNKKFEPLFSPALNDWKAEGEAISLLKKYSKRLSFKIILGFWCEDSYLWVPRFLSFLDNAGIDEEQYKLFGVDKNKMAGFEGYAALKIINVPTFIIYYDKREIGRIVEHPEQGLSEDLVKMIKRVEQK